MGCNQLCGLGYDGNGTYTTEGITILCEMLRGSAITSLGCAAAPYALYTSILTASADVIRAPSKPRACTHSVQDNSLREEDKEAIRAVFKGPPANLQL